MPTLVHKTPAAAMRRLEELGVPLEALQKAVSAGHVARITCSENDPPFIPGTEAWRYTVVTLREELGPRGWRKSDPGNFSLIVNDARKLNIVVASADQFTRLAHGSPRTKSLKGLYTEAVTIRNRVEGDFFPEDLEDELRRAIMLLEHPTWHLLIYITDEEFRAELSMPVNCNSGHITEWQERIFIPDTSEPSGGRISSPKEDTAADIDVPVRRRKA